MLMTRLMARNTLDKWLLLHPLRFVSGCGSLNSAVVDSCFLVVVGESVLASLEVSIAGADPVLLIKLGVLEVVIRF